ncbi:MAG: hypothetical protein WB609_10780 [Candidatus Cybelea sp.]
MVRKVDILALVAGLSILAACSSGQPTSQAGFSAVPPGQQGRIPLAITPDKDCAGAGGVTVAPCPVRLTRHTKSGIIVTVSGPGVVNSYLGRINGCFNGRRCYNAERVGSSETQWLITSGRSCGRADVEFDGVNASGGRVGYYFLKVANKYCR